MLRQFSKILVRVDREQLVTRNPKIIWEQPHRHPRGREWTRPLRVLAMQCPLQTSPITQLWVRDIIPPCQCHVAFILSKVAGTRDFFLLQFRKFFVNANFDLVTNYTLRETNKRCLHKYIVRTEIHVLSISHTRVKYVSLLLTHNEKKSIQTNKH